MFSRVPRFIWWGGLAILGVAMAWLAGNHQGRNVVQGQLSELQARSDAERMRLQDQSVRLQMEIDRRTIEGEISDARSAALQAALDGSLKQSADDAAELALYRKIGGSSEPRGVWVDHVSLVEGEPELLAITLVQSRGRDRAAGRIGVYLSGGTGGPERFWVVTDSLTGNVAEKRDGRPALTESVGSSPVVSDDLVTIESFDLRFFQTVLVKVKNITTIDPEYVEIHVQPDGTRLKPSVHRFRWDEIRS